MIAESTNAPTNACFLNFLRMSGERIPSLVRTNTTTGNWKTNPQAKTTVVTVLM